MLSLYQAISVPGTVKQEGNPNHRAVGKGTGIPGREQAGGWLQAEPGTGSLESGR